jgi:hypothetical protein
MLAVAAGHHELVRSGGAAAWPASLTGSRDERGDAMLVFGLFCLTLAVINGVQAVRLASRRGRFLATFQGLSALPMSTMGIVWLWLDVQHRSLTGTVNALIAILGLPVVVALAVNAAGAP